MWKVWALRALCGLVIATALGGAKDYSVFQGGTWPDFVYESFSWELSFYVPHDVNALIEKCGGKEPFTRRLDTYFLMRNGINGGIWGCSKSRTNRDF